MEALFGVPLALTPYVDFLLTECYKNAHRVERKMAGDTDGKRAALVSVIHCQTCGAVYLTNAYTDY